MSAYACLAVARVARTVFVAQGDQLPDDVTQDTLEAWWHAHVADPARRASEEAAAAWDEGLTAYRAQSSIRVVEAKVDDGGLRRVWVDLEEVTFPDGRTVRVEEGTGAATIDKSYASAKGPRPHPSSGSYEAWRKQVTTKVVTEWKADFYLGDGEARAVDLAADDWRYAAPVDAVVRTLNRLAAEGWRVVHVSEDRGLFAGTVVPETAAVVTARYLLARVSGA